MRLEEIEITLPVPVPTTLVVITPEQMRKVGVVGITDALRAIGLRAQIIVSSSVGD